jgi:hypothetical protein
VRYLLPLFGIVVWLVAFWLFAILAVFINAWFWAGVGICVVILAVVAWRYARVGDRS